ncbi:hydroxypyruvate isomerase family protein [Salinimicrobium sp. GXAS 041]|uniref:hydroxypyruvate isomerase family protein n=1 Tax=Salinimicrobium sp. GXAS 041 TaxID=3400806 RepID=UPI003C742A3D
MKNKFSRREALKNIALGTGAIGLGSLLSSFSTSEEIVRKSVSTSKSRINHSVCRWTFQDMPLEKLAAECSKMGISAIDLLRPSEWEIVEKYGLKCSMATDSFASIEHGFNDPENHAELQKNYKELIEQASKQGIKNVICFSGNRNGMDEQTGIKNCAKGLLPLLEYAEARDVTLVMELLNSKVNHPDYLCDHTEWGVALAKEMGKDNFKLLYDIYHMQIMEGDVIATIRKYHPYINHYHTAGVPGRNEIDETQELFYPAIIRAIAETGFEGYVAQEFMPTYPDKLGALKAAIEICDV